VGGVWSYAVELCAGLGAHGVEVALASKGAPLRADQRAQVAALENVELFESRFRCEWMESPWDDVARASEWMLELAGRVRPDVVHLNDYAHGALEFGAPVVVVGHSCVKSWWRAVRRTPLPPEWNRYLQVVTEGLRAADAVVAPTRWMLASLLEDYGPFRASRAISNGRTLPLTCRENVGVRAKEALVFTAGRLWDEAKNVAALTRVAPGLPWEVAVAGEAALRQPLPHVRFLGQLSAPEIAQVYSRAAIYALPARYEPFGLSVLEAAHSGCALVLGDLPSLRELWDGAARFVSPDDDAALESAIRELIASPALRTELGDQARDRAARFTPERMSNAYLDLYRRLLSAKDAGCASSSSVTR
jgi:glycosyltransferase involved in cell wall biosynthesis